MVPTPVSEEIWGEGFPSSFLHNQKEKFITQESRDLLNDASQT